MIKKLDYRNLSLRNSVLICFFLLTYGVLFYYMISLQLRLDFSSFYSSAVAYVLKINPYENLNATYLLQPTLLPANLNPPFFLQLMVPLTYFDFPTAAAIWYIASFILGFIGAILLFKISCSEHYFKKRWLTLIFIYLSMFATLMNTTISQMGTILLFFIMAGYYCYLHQKDRLAGLCWGIIIAIKFFPALLFFFVLNQKRYTVFFVMLSTCLLAFLLPLLTEGVDIYSLYLKMLPKVLWFGDSWNASLCGLLFRLFIDETTYTNAGLIKLIYLFFFIILLGWYLKKIYQWQKETAHHKVGDHREFCLTLCMMLLLSPLGWLYYFPLLLLPLMILWQSCNTAKTSSTPLLWTLSIFLINFPTGYVEVKNMGSFINKLSFNSLYFYGLLIIVFLVSRLKVPTKLISFEDEKNNKPYVQSVQLSLILGIFIVFSCFIIQGFMVMIVS
jgi:hypothetical protein